MDAIGAWQSSEKESYERVWQPQFSMQPSKVFNVLFFSNFARQPRRIDIRPAWRSRQGSYVYPREPYFYWHSQLPAGFFPGSLGRRISLLRASLKISCKSEIDFVRARPSSS